MISSKFAGFSPHPEAIEAILSTHTTWPITEQWASAMEDGEGGEIKEQKKKKKSSGREKADKMVTQRLVTFCKLERAHIKTVNLFYVSLTDLWSTSRLPRRLPPPHQPLSTGITLKKQGGSSANT